MSQDLPQKAKRLGLILNERKEMLCTVESCTGGMLAQTLTSLAGSSAWYERGFVTYSNLAKQEVVGVDLILIERFGAVSVQVAKALAEGGLAKSQANYCISITGIAGPGGESSGKPVGTVCFGWSSKTSLTQIFSTKFTGDRSQVRQKSVDLAITKLIKLIKGI